MKNFKTADVLFISVDFFSFFIFHISSEIGAFSGSLLSLIYWISKWFFQTGHLVKYLMFFLTEFRPTGT